MRLSRQAVELLRPRTTAANRHLFDTSREAWAFAIYADLLERNEATLNAVIVGRRRGVTLPEVFQELHERLDELVMRWCDPRREINRLAREFELEEYRLALLARGGKLPECALPELEWIDCDPASSFLVLADTIGVSLSTWERGQSLGLLAARIFTHSAPDRALNLLLRIGRPSDVPHDGATFKALLVAPDKDRRKHHMEIVVGHLLRLVSGSPKYSEHASVRGEVGYLENKIAFLLHLLSGTVVGAPQTGIALFSEILDAACRTHDSAVVELTGAGWTELLILFQRLIDLVVDAVDKDGSASCAPASLDAVALLEALLQIAEPQYGRTGHTESARTSEDWPDPFRILTWQRIDQDGTSASHRSYELRSIGRKLVDAARGKLGMPDCGASKSLDRIQKHYKAAIKLATGRRRDVLGRRYAVVSALIAECPEAAPAAE